MTPILDSLAHPTLTGDWSKHPGSCSFAQLARALTEAGYLGACAIGMAGVEGYEHQAFIAACRPYPQLIPIAGFDPVDDAAQERLAELKALGFRGIKIHPRYSGMTRHLAALAGVVRAAGEQGLVVFLCTYLHGPLAAYPRHDPLYDIVELLEQAPATRVVLVHGGDVNLMRYAELVRFNGNLLLDLSLTMMKYIGSSLDLDLRFLFASFDRRICIGTDFPEYTPAEVRARFEDLAGTLPPDKRANIAHANLASFLGWQAPPVQAGGR